MSGGIFRFYVHRHDIQSHLHENTGYLGSDGVSSIYLQVVKVKVRANIEVEVEVKVEDEVEVEIEEKRGQQLPDQPTSARRLVSRLLKEGQQCRTPGPRELLGALARR